MIKSLALALALIMSMEVQAAPVLLACPGEYSSLAGSNVPGTPTITIDIAADTLAWDTNAARWLFHGLREVGDWITSRLDLREHSVNYAFDIAVNRVTGEITWHQTDYDNEHSMTFAGVCKPAQKLF